MALLRALMGAVVILHLWPDLRSDVLAVERFHVPWWSWLPVPSPGLYRALLCLGALAGVAMLVGLAARAATAVALVIVVYLLFVDMTGFSHNRGFLAWLLLGLVLAPRGPPVGLGRRGASPGHEVGVLWPLLLVRVVVSSVYLTSGLTKLINPDWRSGLVLWDRVVRFQHEIPFDGWAHDLLTSRGLYRLLSPGAIAVELFLGIGLWFPRTRLVAIWVALVFHGSIEVTAAVQTFSYSAIAALLLWVTPASRDRTLVSSSARLGAVVRRLDWLHRFRIDENVGRDPDTTVLIDRDGTVRRDRDARLTVLSRLPMLFPFVAPALAVHRLTQTRTSFYCSNSVRNSNPRSTGRTA